VLYGWLADALSDPTVPIPLIAVLLVTLASLFRGMDGDLCSGNPVHDRNRLPSTSNLFSQRLRRRRC
jgi:hypothetical protein